MRFADLNFLPCALQHQIGNFLLICMLLCSEHVTHSLFRCGKQYTYMYNVTSSSGVLLPSTAASSWGLHGKLIIRAEQNSTVMQLQSLQTTIQNGKLEEQGKHAYINGNTNDLLKPFEVTYNHGLLQNFSVQSESVWVTNIKRSIAGVLQLDLDGITRHVAFYSTEVNHYGQCNIEYLISQNAANESLIRKAFDPRNCIGDTERSWTNVPKMQCLNYDQNPIVKSSERQYKINFKSPYERTVEKILFINATGEIYVQPFQSYGEVQFHFIRQVFELVSITDELTISRTDDVHTVGIQHELPQSDLTQGRGTPDKLTIFKFVGNLLDRLSDRLENPGLDTNTSNLHNTTISVLLYYLGMLNHTDLRAAYSKISGTSYKDETMRNIFLETLPQIGSKEAALFILRLIQEKKVSDITSVQLLTQLPFHIQKPDVELLISLQSLLSLSNGISSEVQNTAILAYGTLIYKTCLSSCPYEMLDDYVRLYLDKFTESSQYEQKMVWLEGLANIQLGRVVEFLEPIASSNNAESQNFRVLAAWASLPTAPMRPDMIYPVYLPILINRTESLEMRIAALTLLIVSNPTPSRLISLYWYIQTEPCPHLYNYFYTTLKSMEGTTHPCYMHIGGLAAQFMRIIRQPSTNRRLLTGNYMFDYHDTKRKFGAMFHGVIIANTLTNIPEVMHITLNNYGNGVNINQISLYIKGEGLLHGFSTHFPNPTQIRSILEQYRLDQRKSVPIHLEIILRIHQKTILCIHLNETSISKAFQYLSSLPENFYHIYEKMEFHVNQQRINIPLTMESVQVTDLGSNVRIAQRTTSMFSIRGNFTHTLEGRNNHVILRTSVHGSQIIENYNPLMDLWQGAERAQSIHGYLPINITIGIEDHPFILYNTPGEYMKTGLTAHVKTVTNIRGAQVTSKLKQMCSECPIEYIVTSTPASDIMTITLLEAELPEFGGHASLNLFDCENKISQGDIISNILTSHRANYQIFPVMQYALLGVHLVDYLWYVPPKGSCGIAAYTEPLNISRSQIKLHYVKSGKNHMISLTNHALESPHPLILHQWNLAAIYETTGWISDTLKVKITKIAPGKKVFKFCLEAEKDMPWDWDFLSTQPSDPAQIKLNIAWGFAEMAKGKCKGSHLQITLLGEISKQQIDNQQRTKWPYAACHKESEGKTFIPYTDSCYEVSRELSTFRKYQASFQYENVPHILTKFAWKLRAFYDLIGGNSSDSVYSDRFTVTATFPKGSNSGELQLNSDRVSIIYDCSVIDFFLTRTRIHKYIDLPLFGQFFSTCIITSDFISSGHNISFPHEKSQEILLLGQCYDTNPRFALTSKNSVDGIIVNVTDELGTVSIMPHNEGGAVYNSTLYIQLEKNFIFHTLGSKRIRLDDRSVDVLLPSIFLFMHWTPEQVLVYFPKYVMEFSCGMCTISNTNVNNLYQKFTED